MYTLGIPNRQYRRATQVLGPESAAPISYEAHKQDDGFYMFSFPDVDEYDFEEIVLLLKKNGITTIGADDQLTERNIMKLTDLLKEESDQLDRWKTDQDRIKKRYAYTQGTPSPDENELIDILKKTLESWEKPDYRGGIEDCPKSDHYFEDIKDVIEDYEEDLGGDAIAMGADDAKDMEEQEDRGTNTKPKQSGTETEKVKIDILGDEQEVTIKSTPGKGLKDVTISWNEPWGEEIHTVDFEYEDKIDDHGNEGMDLYFTAEASFGDESNNIWEFGLEVYATSTYDDTGDIEDWDWNTLEIKKSEKKQKDVEEGTCGYGKNGKIGKKPAGPDMLQEEKRLLQIRAGIIK